MSVLLGGVVIGVRPRPTSLIPIYFRGDDLSFLVQMNIDIGRIHAVHAPVSEVVHQMTRADVPRCFGFALPDRERFAKQPDDLGLRHPGGQVVPDQITAHPRANIGSGAFPHFCVEPLIIKWVKRVADHRIHKCGQNGEYGEQGNGDAFPLILL